MFWLCILIRHLSELKHYWQDFELHPVTLLTPLCSAQRGHKLQNHMVSESCPGACSGLPSSQISIAARFGEGQVSLKDHRIWFICEVSCFMEFCLCFPHSLCWHHISYGLCVHDLSLDLLSKGLTDIRMTLLKVMILLVPCPLSDCSCNKQILKSRANTQYCVPRTLFQLCMVCSMCCLSETSRTSLIRPNHSMCSFVT